MFDLFEAKPKFYRKCKALIKLTNTRVDGLKKKRNAVKRFLRNDVAEFLKIGLDTKAYDRAEGFLEEQNMLHCYEFIEKFCECIASQLDGMLQHRDWPQECPQECREAMQSLIYAAARLADLPELRDMRAIFTDKYGNSLEPYVNKEFVEKLKATPPSKEMKIQLMQQVAKDFSIEWSSKALEQKLFKPPERDNAPNSGELEVVSSHSTTGQDSQCTSSEDEVESKKKDPAGDGTTLHRTKSDEETMVSDKPKKKHKHTRSNSLQLDEIDSLTAHVHPKLPDCDELEARIAALRGA